MELRVALAQLAVTEDVEANVAAIERAVEFAAAEGADILLTPEGSLSGYTHLFAVFGPFDAAEERQRAVAEELDRAQPAAIVHIPNNMTSGPGVDSFLARWLTRRLARDYVRHAVVVWGDEDRGALVRLRDAAGRPQAVPDGHLWAAIYLRKDADAPAPQSD